MKTASFTQAQIRRCIAAARKEGMRIVGIRPDGVVIVNDGDNDAPLVPPLPIEGKAPVQRDTEQAARIREATRNAVTAKVR